MITTPAYLSPRFIDIIISAVLSSQMNARYSPTSPRLLKRPDVHREFTLTQPALHAALFTWIFIKGVETRALHSTLRVEGYRSWLLSRGLRALRRAFSPSSCSREDERTRRDKQAGRGRKMHKQDRTNGREFKNGTTGASVGYYFPRWGECGMVARTAVKFCRQSVSFYLFPLFPLV